MALNEGTRLGHYDVTALIGEGGMGQVWQATDTQLNRQVALKILPDAFAADPDRLARFQREAQVLASLNHPNIAQIHGVEESEGTRALVLELVEGPTLADRISKGPIPVDEALPIAKQIAEALEAAHEAGVIHRDLKPANIKVREDGTVKVLDFGLAKALAGDAPDADLSQSPTVTAAGTREGVILGTAAYMSPEQARGKPLDKRTDIWSFGCVLFEMLTGKSAFGGETISDTIANVLSSDADWDVLPAGIPPLIGKLLRRCLQRDGRDRLQHVGDARLEIAEAQRAPHAARTARGAIPEVSVWQRPMAVALLTLVAVALAGLALRPYFGSGSPPAASPKRLTVTLPESEQLPRGGGEVLALSPDGQTLLYRARAAGTGVGLQDERLMRRGINQFEATPLLAFQTRSFFSPDGQRVGFYANSRLNSVAVAGGAPQRLTPPLVSYIRGADWGPDDQIVFGIAERGGLMQVSASGGEPTPLFTSDDGRRSWYPEILADGDVVLFTLTDHTPGGGELHVLRRSTGEHRTLLPNAAKGRVLTTGHLVFVRDGALWAVPFAEDRHEVVGAPVPVLEGVRVDGGGAASVQYEVTDNGATLVYVPGGSSNQSNTMVLVNRDGAVQELPGPSRRYSRPRFSPDGNRIAAQIFPSNISVYEVSTSRFRQLTFDGGSGPLWMPDGGGVSFLNDGSDVPPHSVAVRFRVRR